jgi:quinol monooxygenase YgiN
MKKNIAPLFFAIWTLSMTIGCASHPEQKDIVTTRLTRYEVKPGFRIVFRQALDDYILYSLKQETNIMSEAYFEQQDTSALWLIERWSSREALDKAGEDHAFTSIGTLTQRALMQPTQTYYAHDLEPLSKQQWRVDPPRKDSALTIMLFVDAKPGTANTFKEVYHTAMPAFRGEPGVVNYQLSQLDEDSTRFVTYEKFRDEEAFRYHLGFPPIKPVLDYLETSIKKQPFQAGLHRLIEFSPHILH